MEPLVNMQLVVNELSFKKNDLPNGTYNVHQHTTRTVRKIDDSHYSTELTVKILNTEEEPFPADIRASLTGIFELSNIPKEEIGAFLNIKAVQILYPYLRTMISSLTSSALLPPIVLPIVDVHDLFPEE